MPSGPFSAHGLYVCLLEVIMGKMNALDKMLHRMLAVHSPAGLEIKGCQICGIPSRGEIVSLVLYSKSARTPAAHRYLESWVKGEC